MFQTGHSPNPRLPIIANSPAGWPAATFGLKNHLPLALGLRLNPVTGAILSLLLCCNLTAAPQRDKQILLKQNGVHEKMCQKTEGVLKPPLKRHFRAI